jgi:hypothetical protein
VQSLSLKTTRHKITAVIVRFSGEMDAASAGNVANYAVHLLTSHRSKHGTRMTSLSRAVGVSSATYDPSSQSVTLQLGAALRPTQMFQVAANGGSGGLTDGSGNPLNGQGPQSSGSNFVYNVNAS